jgi:hypothetical protein
LPQCRISHTDELSVPGPHRILRMHPLRTRERHLAIADYSGFFAAASALET